MTGASQNVRYLLILFAAGGLALPLRGQLVLQADTLQPPQAASPGPLRGHQLVSQADISIPPGASYVLGIELSLAYGERSLTLSTVSEVYKHATSNIQPGFTKVLIASDYVENIDTTSSVITDPHSDANLLYSSVAVFSPSVTSVMIALPHATVVYPFPNSVNSTVNGLIASDSSGALYVYRAGGIGIQKFDYQNSNFSSPLFTTATSGAGAVTDVSHGFAVANHVIYLLDPGNDTVFRYDADSGGYLGHFAVTGAGGASAIAVSNNGRLYLTAGNGGGNIYNATTGKSLGTFVAGADVDTDGTYPYQGLDGIVIDDSNRIFYAEDVATGVHVFYDPALHGRP